MLDAPEVQFALDAVGRAARLVAQVQQEMILTAAPATHATLTKDDQSPVTVGDFAAQAVVARLLGERFPDDPLVAEEDAQELREATSKTTLEQVTSYVRIQFPEATPESTCDWIDRGGGRPSMRFWTLDPIDGTKGFLRGEQYAVALALLEEGEVRLGVLGCPNLAADARPASSRGAIFFALRGHGAFATALEVADGSTEPIPLAVSSHREPAEARLLRSVESSHTHGGKIDQLAQALAVQAAPLHMDSQAKYAVLAAGKGDVLMRLLSPSRPKYREKIWDQAAGSILVEEAGGCVTDLDGKPLDFTRGRTLAENRGLLATNGLLHELFQKTLAAAGA